MSKFPSLSSRELIKLLEKGGDVFVRQGSTDHAIYARVMEGKRYRVVTPREAASCFPSKRLQE